MYFLTTLIILSFSKTLLAQDELRCFECENCPDPFDKQQFKIIKCHEGNVITTTTETDTTVDTTENSYVVEYQEELESEDETMTEYAETVDARFNFDQDFTGFFKEEYEFACYKIVFKDTTGSLVTNRGCAMKLEQDNDTCFLANYESNEFESCVICTEEICNRGSSVSPQLLCLLKTLAPLFIIFLM